MRFIENRFSNLFFYSIPLMIWLIDYDVNSILDQSFSFCIFKNVFSEECHGCGLLRGLSAALHLDLLLI